MPHGIISRLRKALTIITPVHMPAHALVMSKAIALLKPKCFLSLIDVLGSNETRKFGPSYLEMLQQISRSTCSGLYLELARQSSMAFLARSIENSVSPAIRLDCMPVNRSSGNSILCLQPRKTSSVETTFGGR